jgi:hypothetical protein
MRKVEENRGMTAFCRLWYNVKQGFCLDYNSLRETSRNENNIDAGGAGARRGRRC